MFCHSISPSTCNHNKKTRITLLSPLLKLKLPNYTYTILYLYLIQDKKTPGEKKKNAFQLTAHPGYLPHSAACQASESWRSISYPGRSARSPDNRKCPLVSWTLEVLWGVRRGVFGCVWCLFDLKLGGFCWVWGFVLLFGVFFGMFLFGFCLLC